MLDHGAIAQGNATPEAILADELHWQARLGDRYAHYFKGGYGTSACRAQAWTLAHLAGLEVPRCLSCEVALGHVTEAEARVLNGRPLMPALPRATCPVCGKSVAVRNGGQLREHYVYRSQLEQDPSTPLGRVRVCEGSGRPA